jgi:integrase
MKNQINKQKNDFTSLQNQNYEDKINTIILQKIFTDKDREVLKKYNVWLRVKGASGNGNKLPTVEERLRIIFHLYRANKKDFKKYEKEDVERFLANASKELCLTSLAVYKHNLRIFFQWLYNMRGENLPKVVEDLKVRIPESTKEKLLLSPDEVKTLLEKTDTIRDKALLFFMWDTGCRVSEALNLKIEDLKFDDYGGVVFLNGKTGIRKNRLVECLPIIKEYVNHHGFNKNPKSPLFYKIENGECYPLKPNTIHVILQTLTGRAKIQKHIHSHMFRRCKATRMDSEGYSESEIRIQLGWSKGSTTPEKYIMVNEKSYDEKVKRKNGMITDEEISKQELKNKALNLKKCPRCQEKNDACSIYCFKCGMLIDNKAWEDVVKLFVRKEFDSKTGKPIMISNMITEEGKVPNQINQDSILARYEEIMREMKTENRL